MPKSPAFADALRAIIAHEVDAALEPLRAILSHVAEVTGAPARRGPGRPRKATGPGKASKPRQRRGAKARRAQALARKFRKGQKVSYRQGRGTFDARVLAIDPVKGVLKLVRAKDSKKVSRPAAKVFAAR